MVVGLPWVAVGDMVVVSDLFDVFWLGFGYVFGLGLALFLALWC